MSRQKDDSDEGNRFRRSLLAAAATSVAVSPVITAISSTFFSDFQWWTSTCVVAFLGFTAFIALVSSLSARYLGPVRPLLYGCLSACGSATIWIAAGWVFALANFDSTNLGIAAIALGFLLKWAAAAGAAACLYTGIVSTIMSWCRTEQ